ncbi:MAG: LacI family DNA-binding transcriptional regulator [Actinomycetes bacterium]
MAPPPRLTSLTDVAERAGVSVATASRVLSDSDYPVAGRTRRRVLEAAAELDFAPNLIARGLVARRTHLIGMIVPSLTDARYAAIASGVEHMATENGFTLIILSTGGDAEGEVAALRRLRSMRVEAVIVPYGSVGGRDQQARLSAQMIQVEAAGGVIVRLAPHPRVNPDAAVSTRQGLSLAVDHLVSLGHKAIGLLTGPARAGGSQVGVYAMRQALRQHRLTLREGDVVATDGTMPGGRGAAAEFVSGRAPVTAVVALTDELAIGFLRGCRDSGLSVPDDVSVVGFDDVPQAAFTTPALTTVRVPHFDLGVAGMQVAIWLLGGGARTGRNNLPVELVVRESTAAPRRVARARPSKKSAVKQPAKPSTRKSSGARKSTGR